MESVPSNAIESYDQITNKTHMLAFQELVASSKDGLISSSLSCVAEAISTAWAVEAAALSKDDSKDDIRASCFRAAWESFSS